MDLEVYKNKFKDKVGKLYNQFSQSESFVQKLSEFENNARGHYLSFEQRKMNEYLTDEIAEYLLTLRIIKNIKSLPLSKIEKKINMMDKKYGLKLSKKENSLFNINFYEFIPETEKPQYRGWLNISNEMGDPKKGEGSLTFYAINQRIRKINGLEEIMEGKQFWEKNLEGKYKSAKCLKNEMMVKRKSGFITTKEEDSKQRISMANYSPYEYKSLQNNPVSEEFWKMDYQYEENEKDKVKKIESLPTMGGFYLSSFHLYPMPSRTPDFSLNILKKLFPKIGIEITSSKPISKTNKLIFSMDFKLI